MSTSDQIYLRTGLTPAVTAARIARALDLRFTKDDHGTCYVGRRIGGDQDQYVGGDVDFNHPDPYPEPGEMSVTDGYDIEFEVRCTLPGEEQRLAATRDLFTEIIENFDWPALLVHDLELLMVAWSPQLGRHDFPEGTLTNQNNSDVWAPYALPRIAPPKQGS